MRMLMVAPNIVSFKSFLLELCETLSLRGVDVHCACSGSELWGGKGGLQGQELQMHHLELPRGVNPFGHFRSAAALNGLVSSLRPDLVHAHFSAAVFTTALARRSCWPVTIGTFHGLRFPLMTGLGKRVFQGVEGWSARRLDAVWVLTEDDRTALVSAAPGAKVHRCTSYGVGCDLARFRRETLTMEACSRLRLELGLPDNAMVFAFVGRFVDFKGFDVAVRAFWRLAASYPNARLLLIGDFDRLHPSGLTREEEERLRASPMVVHAGWRTDVEKWLAISSALLAPSSREGMPVSIMEALSMGVPVVTRDSRGCRDVVRHGVNGLVVDPCSVENLAAAMAELTVDDALRRRLSANALENRRDFDRKRYVDEQIAAYEDMLGGSV